MAPYDSDSSEGEDGDYTETNVLLGYASKDPGDDPTSRLGGRPDWLDANTPPSAALARCKICKDLMVLLLQLNGELPDRFPGHERRLYVFACRRKSCRRREGSIRALRSVRIAPGVQEAAAAKNQKREEKPKPKREEDPAPKPPSNLGETLFGAKTMGNSSASANPFSTSSSAGGTSSNPFATPTSTGNPFSSNPAPTSKNPEPKSEPEPPKPESQTEKDLTTLPQTFAETLSLNNPQHNEPATAPVPEPWPEESAQPKPYPPAYLSEADYETLDPTPASVPQQTRMDIDNDPTTSSSSSGRGGREDREVFESSMDSAFQKFADRLAQNPEQCIRYEFGGSPLLYSRTDAVGVKLAGAAPDGAKILTTTTTAATGGGGGGKGGSGGMPRCPNCGAPRTFEVQLCPHAIAELEAEDEEEEKLSLEGMDWGTVIVGVCERDCQARGVDSGGVGYLEEWAGVQWEEEVGRK
ncbi:programmed cell death protein 2 [Xylariomycetidae sp. FL2044]|nr:programmed cell death protein 2 [Xylariomycetidae sp. FL2044]